MIANNGNALQIELTQQINVHNINLINIKIHFLSTP